MVLAAFIAYFILVLGVGYYFYNKSHNMEDYILGGRSMNPYVTAMSAQASDMSSWLLMGLPGAVLLLGLGEAWIGIGLAIGSYLSWLFVAKKLRVHSEVSGNALTMPEFFSNRFKDNKGILRTVAAVIILFFFVIYVASGFKGCGTILTTIFPEISVEIAMIIGGIVIIAYTFMGGYKAVSWTDFFQAILMVIAIIVVPLATIGNTTGGWDAIQAGLNDLGTDFLDIFYDGGSALGIISILSLLAWAFGYFGMPHIVVRYMSIRDPKEVKVARRVSLIWIILALTFAILVGIVGRGYLIIEYGGIPEGFNAEHIFVFLSGELFPSLIAGVLYAAIMAAIMSTADSQLLVSSSSITNDILGKTKWAARQDNLAKKLMWIARTVVALVAVLALILALSGSDSIMGLVSYAWAGFGAAFGPLMILSLYWKRMNLPGAMAAMFVGFATVILWNTFLSGTGIYELLPGFIFSFIAGIVVSLATPAPDDDVIDEYDKAEAVLKESQ